MTLIAKVTILIEPHDEPCGDKGVKLLHAYALDGYNPASFEFDYLGGHTRYVAGDVPLIESST